MVETRTRRRLAAILAADVVGYSRLMEHDETGTLAALKARRQDLLVPLVARHGGRVVKVMGDGVLVEFASPVDAVQCAAALQEGFHAANQNLPEGRWIVLRIGINLGDVIVEGSDIYGDGVNLAARLEAMAEPGDILISSQVYDHVAGKLAITFESLGERTVKNIMKPVRVFRAVMPTRRVAELDLRHTQQQASIAVLPFTNMSSDAEQEFFADGLSEDLITDLSKVKGLFVIARHSTFVYKGKSIDVRQAARELGVNYIVEGSVRRSVSRLRITVQLIDARDGRHVWADRFDRALEEFFAVQDEVVTKIVDALASALPTAQLPPKRRPPSLAAYDLFAKGRSMTMQSVGEIKQARQLLEKAISLDEGFAEAHAWLALNLLLDWFEEKKDELRELALREAGVAISLDPNNPDAHFVFGYAQLYMGFLTEGRTEFELALRLNLNHAEAWAFLSDLEVLDGQPERAIQAIEKAFLLNPTRPNSYYWLLGWAQYATRRYEAAIETLKMNPNQGDGSQRILAAALAQLGRIEEAREVARQFHIAQPEFRVSAWAKTQPFRDPADLQHFVEGYLTAGLPS
jgi:TolB-like protein